MDMTLSSKSKKQSAEINFKKARTLIDTIIGMLDEDRYCVDIMQQNLAVIGLLRSAHEQLMTNHLETCFADAMHSKSDAKKQRMTDEIKTLMKMYNK
jgi:CsoR family transcriptional regulator, copper-sensing transcriptional repressor